MTNVWNNLYVKDLQYTNSTSNIVNSVVAGTGISVDNTTPTAPIISKTFEGISVYLPSNVTITSGNAIGSWSITSYTQFYTNSNFNLSTGEYTVPSTGYYLICVTVLQSSGDVIIKNGSNIIGQQRRVQTAANPCFTCTWSDMVYLNTNDIITVSVNTNVTITALLNSAPYTTLSITKMS